MVAIDYFRTPGWRRLLKFTYFIMVPSILVTLDILLYTQETSITWGWGTIVFFIIFHLSALSTMIAVHHAVSESLIPNKVTIQFLPGIIVGIVIEGDEIALVFPFFGIGISYKKKTCITLNTQGVVL